MNYIDEIAREIYTITSPDDELTADSEWTLYRIYAVLVLSTSIKTTSRHVHDAWSAWTAGYASDHPSLIPFDDLSERIQSLDDHYRDAIRIVAGRRAGMAYLDDGTRLSTLERQTE